MVLYDRPHMTYYQSAFVTIAVCGIVFKLFDVE